MHAAVYALAEKNGITRLKDLALENIWDALELVHTDDAFFDVVGFIYDNTPEDDTLRWWMAEHLVFQKTGYGMYKELADALEAQTELTHYMRMHESYTDVPFVLKSPKWSLCKYDPLCAFRILLGFFVEKNKCLLVLNALETDNMVVMEVESLCLLHTAFTENLSISFIVSRILLSPKAHTWSVGTCIIWAASCNFLMWTRYLSL